MKPKKIMINGESITWRFSVEYFYKNDEIRGINDTSSAVKINNNPYRSIKNANFSIYFGIIATIILLYNKANDKDIRISTTGKIKEYMDWYFDRIDISYVRWIYNMEKDKNFNFDEKALLQRSIGQMRELYPYSFMLDFNYIDKDLIEQYDKDDDDRYDIWRNYIDTLSKKFILNMVDELDTLVKQGKLNEFNPLNDMNKAITIQDISSKEEEGLKEVDLLNIDKEKDEIVSEMAKRFQEIVLGINNANPFIRRQFDINDESEVETREIDYDIINELIGEYV